MLSLVVKALSQAGSSDEEQRKEELKKKREEVEEKINDYFTETTIGIGAEPAFDTNDTNTTTTNDNIDYDGNLNSSNNNNLVEGEGRRHGVRDRGRDRGRNGKEKNKNCFEDIGIVTALNNKFVIIKENLKFEFDEFTKKLPGLRVGALVRFLAFSASGDSQNLKVVKILKVVDEAWDSNDTQPPLSASASRSDALTQTQAQISNSSQVSNSLQYFEVDRSTVFGLVLSIKATFMVVEVESGTVTVALDKCPPDYKPVEGDKIVMNCQTQINEDYFDKTGEVVKVFDFAPTRIIKNQERIVLEVYDDWGVLSEGAFFIFDILDENCQPKVSDVVEVTLIECNRGIYERRALQLKIKKSEQQLANSSSKKMRRTKDKEDDDSLKQVSITKNVYCVLEEIGQQRTVEIVLKNNRDNIVTLKEIYFEGNRSNSQLTLEDSKDKSGFQLFPDVERTVKFIVKAKHFGITNEYIQLRFDHFSVQRCIKVAVCGSQDEIQAFVDRFENRAEGNTALSVMHHKSNAQKNRLCAYQVWNSRRRVIPGVGFDSRRFIARKIGTFEVPPVLKRAYLSSDKSKEMDANLEQLAPELRCDLSFQNYSKRFELLIYLEEIECFVNFRKFDKERCHFVREGEYLTLEVENLNENKSGPTIGDFVRALNFWTEGSRDDVCFEGVIHKVKQNKIYAKFNPAFHNKYNGEDYRIEFYFSRFTYRKQHHAIQKIVQHLGESFLFPRRFRYHQKPKINVKLNDENNLEVDGVKQEWFNSHLNDVQKQAICQILRREAIKMPYILFGPPGTGKTITVVETILQIKKHLSDARILVATPSNSAADLIATRLIESNAVQQGDFIRLVAHNVAEKELVPPHLCPYSATIDVGTDGSCESAMTTTSSGLKLKCQMKYLGTHRIAIGTFATLGNFHLMQFAPDHFTHVVIDEAAQCTEPDVMIPISLVSSHGGQVILAGDPKQLQAIVASRYAKVKGLGISFLDRLLSLPPYRKNRERFPSTFGYNPNLVTKLIYSYRALPSILKIYNDLFYDSELVTKINDEICPFVKMRKCLQDILPPSKQRPVSHRVFFHGIRSDNKQEYDSPSWFNPLEAKHIFMIVIKLFKKGFKSEQIGIITPYTKQVKHLRLLFRNAEYPEPKIGSVEEFQGQERDIILISTVRSQLKDETSDLRSTLGFVQNPQRTNVAISRARFLNLITGNPHLLVKDVHWKAVIKYCVDNDAYSGCDLPQCLKPPSDEPQPMQQ